MRTIILLTLSNIFMTFAWVNRGFRESSKESLLRFAPFVLV
jgi:uncharacterized protein (DUF486 family)